MSVIFQIAHVKKICRILILQSRVIPNQLANSRFHPGVTKIFSKSEVLLHNILNAFTYYTLAIEFAIS